jgi:hypothetical protein
MLVTNVFAIIDKTREFLFAPILPGGKNVEIEFGNLDVIELIRQYIADNAKFKDVTIHIMLIGYQYISLHLNGQNVKSLLKTFEILGSIDCETLSEFYGSHAAVIKLKSLEEIGKKLTENFVKNLEQHINVSGEIIYDDKTRKSKVKLNGLSDEQLKKLSDMKKNEEIGLYVCNPYSGSKILIGNDQIMRAPETPTVVQSPHCPSILEKNKRTNPGTATFMLNGAVVSDLLTKTRNNPQDNVVLACGNQIIAIMPAHMLNRGSLQGKIDKNLSTKDYQALMKTYMIPLPSINIILQSEFIKGHPLHNKTSIIIGILILLAVALYLVLSKKKRAILVGLISALFLVLILPARINPFFLLLLLMNLFMLCLMDNFIPWVVLSFVTLLAAATNKQFLIQLFLIIIQLTSVFLARSIHQDE